MRVLQIDIETYSSASLKDGGVYRYAEAEDFEILLFAYAYDDGSVQIVDLTKEQLPKGVLDDLTNPDILKTAFNAQFETTCISAYLGVKCDPEQWRCTMVHAMTLGLPASLEACAQSLNLEAKKDMRGKNLIKYFSVPCKPTQTNGGRIRNLPEHNLEKWETFKEYCVQDVVVEREIRRRLGRFPVPEHEWRLWALDQRINALGVRLDAQLFRNAIECWEQYSKSLIEESQKITGLSNPNSLVQLKAWLGEKGVDASEGLSKGKLDDLLRQATDADTKRVLEIRRELGKTSVKKYEAMEKTICRNGRAKGAFQFCGASRTWRWAGRKIQLQNLPQNKIPDLAEARELLKSGDYELFEMLYGPPPFILSQLIRTTIIPEDGYRFIVCDFSAIEARVLAWAADEKWVLDVFKGHGKIYEATAAQMFKVPLETIVKGHKNYELRAKGKVATLACGYGGSAPALISMGALESGVPEEDLPRLVQQWRDANPHIVSFWYNTERAAIKAVEEKTTVEVAHGIRYRFAGGVLFADLPSGRSLAYPKARLKPDEKFKDRSGQPKKGIVFGRPEKSGKWAEERTYHGKLVENLIQAMARDCLAESLMRLDKAGFRIVAHIHDEVVLEVPRGQSSVEEIEGIMSEPIRWARGLPLSAAGFESDFYLKD